MPPHATRAALVLARARALALGLALAAAAPAPALAAGGAPAPPPDPVPMPASLASPEPPAPPEPLGPFPEPPPGVPPEVEPAVAGETTWVDQGHAFLERSIFWPFVKADRFFADDRAVDAELGRSFVRWRNDLRMRGDGSIGYETAVRADLRFPFLSRKLDRLRISIDGQTGDAVDRLFPGDSLLTQGTRQVGAGLGLSLLESLRSQSDAQVGLLFSWPLGWYAKLRFRHAHELGEVALARVALSGFWQTNTGWGTREELSLERLLQPWLLSRLAATGLLTERSRGGEWGTELGLFAQAGEHTALGLAGGGSGATLAGPFVEVWRVLTRARRDVWRRWLFLELEPQVTWTRQLGGGRQRDEVVLLRLEIQFQEGLPTPKD